MNPMVRLRGMLAYAGSVARKRWILIGLLLVGAATAGVWAAFQSQNGNQAELAAMLPNGALVTIEAKDFAGLLKHWNDSSEKAAWLKSDNYSVFSRSRLFGRLGDAQKEFVQSAGLPPDLSFLTEVAGKESVFAWYDIGKLEFLYITRMPSGSAEKNRLVQMRGKFTTRQVGSRTFYVRTQADLPGGGQGDEGQSGQARTVAFATSGDWLLLATREDLMAGALTLMGGMGTSKTTSNSLAEEPWFVDARAAASKKSAELRMTLNLEKIVPSPYFRSYWIQQNISEMKLLRSAVADLYMEPGIFHEERVLLPKNSPDVETTSAPDLAALVALLPQRVGVYRAVASPSMDDAMASVEEKLLQRGVDRFVDSRSAPNADVSVHEAGATTDLETRIDAAPVVHAVKGEEVMPLRQALVNSGLDAMMTISRTGEAVDGIWIPFQSAVVFSSNKEWNVSTMQAALQEAMGARLTAGDMGLGWKPVKVKEGSYSEISEVRPLEMAVNGRYCILADDPALIREVLSHLSNPAAERPGSSTEAASLIAGVSLPQERASFARWSKLVDHAATGVSGNAGEPEFFSQNMQSLGDVFATLEGERIVQRRDGAVTRQTVTYAWRP